MDEVRDLTIDPVCGEEVETWSNDYISKYQGQTYFFCSLNCLLDFEEDPDKYLGPYA